MTADDVANRATFTAPPVDLTFEPDFDLGAARVRPAKLEIDIGGTTEALEPRVMQVLVALAQAAGTTVTRDELIRRCWDGRIVSDHAINRTVSRLRAVAQRDAGASFTIETRAGVGYRLFPAVAPPPKAPSPLSAMSSVAAPMAVAEAPAPKRAKRWVVAAVLLVVAAVVTALLIGNSMPQPAVQRLAVLPLLDTSSARQPWLSASVTEDLVGGLAQEPGLVIVGRSTLKPDAREDLETLARRLNLTHVVEGSVAMADNRLRLNLRLVRVIDGREIWAETFEDSLDALPQIRARVVNGIAETLIERHAGKTRSDPAPALSPGDNRLMLEANALATQRSGKPLSEARRLLTEILERNPEYAPGWAKLSLVTDLLSPWRGYATDLSLGQATADARRFAQRAIALQPQQPDGYIALAQALHDRRAEAAANLERALVLGPSRTDAMRALARAYILLERHREALVLYRVVNDRDPTWQSCGIAGDVVADLGQPEAGERQAAACLARTGSPPEIHAYSRGWKRWKRGDLAGAIAEMSKAVRLAPGDGEVYRVSLSNFWGDAGDAARAGALLDRNGDGLLRAYNMRDATAMAAVMRKRGRDAWLEPSDVFFATVLFNGNGRRADVVALYDQPGWTPDAACLIVGKLPELGSQLAWALQADGRRNEARAMLACAEPVIRKRLAKGYQVGASQLELAEILAVQGDREAAADAVQAAWNAGYRGQTLGPDIAKLGPLSDLVGHPKFDNVRQLIMDHVRQEANKAKSGDGMV
jgi:TolB-like protein/DNA-binding winged helix-turn-helix (wHTH) protein